MEKIDEQTIGAQVMTDTGYSVDKDGQWYQTITIETEPPQYEERPIDASKVQFTDELKQDAQDLAKKNSASVSVIATDTTHTHFTFLQDENYIYPTPLDPPISAPVQDGQYWHIVNIGGVDFDPGVDPSDTYPSRPAAPEPIFRDDGFYVEPKPDIDGFDVQDDGMFVDPYKDEFEKCSEWAKDNGLVAVMVQQDVGNTLLDVPPRVVYMNPDGTPADPDLTKDAPHIEFGDLSTGNLLDADHFTNADLLAGRVGDPTLAWADNAFDTAEPDILILDDKTADYFRQQLLGLSSDSPDATTVLENTSKLGLA